MITRESAVWPVKFKFQVHNKLFFSTILSQIAWNIFILKNNFFIFNLKLKFNWCPAFLFANSGNPNNNYTYMVCVCVKGRDIPYFFKSPFA